YFTTKQTLNSRQIRWSRILQNYNFEIEYRPGNKNQAADALSRKYLKGGEDPTSLTPILKKIINLDAVDSNSEDESDDEEPLIDKRFSSTPEVPIHSGSPDFGSYHSQSELSPTPSQGQILIHSGNPSVGSYNSQEQED